MNKENKRDRVMRRAMKVVRVSQKDDGIKSDVQGCYTGKPIDEDERPVQDADDL